MGQMVELSVSATGGLDELRPSRDVFRVRCQRFVQGPQHRSVLALPVFPKLGGCIADPRGVLHGAVKAAQQVGDGGRLGRELTSQLPHLFGVPT